MGAMKNKFHSYVSILAFAVMTGSAGAAGDPQINSWFVAYSGKYARIYTTDAAKASGATVTTWTNGSLAQSLPAYDGVQEVDSSSNWVYVRSTGLGSHVMGPWYLDAAQTEAFPNYPINQQELFRIPRTPSAGSNTLNGGGPIGCFADGVAMFNSWDAFYWNGSADVSGAGSGGYWNRDAYVNEGVTFDPANAHQPQSGQYHYHANPPALRYFLGDHVNFNAVTDTYSEATNAPSHSPILGWVQDGYPVYGPYGYSNATNPASGVRRMISGYVPRNGSNGSDNISTNGAARSTLPAWALRLYGDNLTESKTGPDVSSSYPFGRYMEDNAFLGDLTNSATGKPWVQGTDFDLDKYNGRWCVTPDFPNGTYAYFVAIDADGTPVFPYNIGRAFYGNPSGGSVNSISETVVTNYQGGPNLAPVLSPPVVNANLVVLTWSATEGGTYEVQSTTNLLNWQTNASSVGAVLNTGVNTNNGANPIQFYRVVRTALADYDPVTGSDAGANSDATITMSPLSGAPGTSYSVTATISASADPPPPPHSDAPVATFTVGSISVTGASYTYNGGSGTVTGTLTIPAGTAAGSQTVTITFSPPPDETEGPTYTQTGAFTIN
jgi:hypothetical protein